MSESKSKHPFQRAIPTKAEPAETMTRPAAPIVESTVAAVARMALPRQENPFAVPDVFALFDAAQTVFARCAEALADEMAGLARSGLATVAETTTAMLGVKTLSDAIEVNEGFFRKSFDTLLAESARLSEIGARLAAEAMQPLTPRN
jgi:phasin family protein